MAGDLMAMSGAAYDAQALNGLRRYAAADPQGNLARWPSRVEGMFVRDDAEKHAFRLTAGRGIEQRSNAALYHLDVSTSNRPADVAKGLEVGGT